METLRIEILNPKVRSILKDLANLKLITISKEENSQSEFKKLLMKLRKNSDEIPTLDEITKEVEEVRALRYEKKGN